MSLESRELFSPIVSRTEMGLALVCYLYHRLVYNKRANILCFKIPVNIIMRNKYKRGLPHLTADGQIGCQEVQKKSERLL